MRDPEDRAAFAMAIEALAAVFAFEATRPVLLGYWTALCDLPLAGVQKACAELLKTAKFMPRPADIRELVPRDSSAPRFMPGAGYVGLLSLPMAHADWTEEQKAEARVMLDALKTKGGRA